MNILLYCQFKEGYNTKFRNRIAECAPSAVLNYCNDNCWTDEEYHKKLEEADVIIGHFNPDDLKYCRSLKFIQMDIEGVDAYVRNPALPEDTVICNAGGAYGTIVAEHAAALTFAVCRDIQTYAENRLEKKWSMVAPDKPVEGSRVLILGAGAIGRKTAEILKPLAGKITGARRVVREVPDVFDAMITLDEVEDELPKTDILICALPSTPETVGFLDARKMRMLPKDAVIVNVGRGSLIPMDDLAEVLNEGNIRGAGIDVFETEPLPESHPLWKCQNLIVTPHSAGNAMSQDSPTNKRIYERIYANIERFVNGQPLLGIIDRNTGYRTTE